MKMVKVAALVLGLAAVAALLWLVMPKESDLPVNTRMGGPIALTNQHGEAFNTKALHGKVVLLFFGYTNCPDICPATLARVTQAWKKLRADGYGDETAVVFITFDPERDTPEHIKKYLAFFDPQIVGLTGSQAEIRAAAEKFGVVFMKDEHEHSDAVLFTHSDFIYLLDQQGRVRKLFPSDGNIEEMVRDAKSLL